MKNSNKKVLLVNAAFNKYGGIKGHGGSSVPLNLCYLAAFGRDKHPDVDFKILDAEALGLSHENTAEEALQYSPDLIGITTNTCVFESVIALTKILKERLPNANIILGGPHVSALPERSLEESEADFVTIGEGEYTLGELIERIKSDKRDYNSISGLAYRDENGSIKVNSQRALIDNLDTIPFPARDLVDNNLYQPPPTKRVSLGANTLIATSRGCPFNCGFCGAQTVWTRKTRRRSPESVVDEIESCVKDHGIISFNFTDELFTSDKRHVLEICRLIRERELKIAWVCSARAQRLDKETLEEMKRAGCHEISFGIESGNCKILKKIDKALDLGEAQRVVSLTKRVGITTHASYILGYIDETEETIKDTINFAKRLNTDVAAFFIASPLPGTPLYNEAKEKGFLRSNASWSDYSPLSNNESVLALPNLSTSVIREWHRRAIKSYYFRLKYIASRLARLRHWYEVVNILAGFKIFFRIKK